MLINLSDDIYNLLNEEAKSSFAYTNLKNKKYKLFYTINKEEEYIIYIYSKEELSVKYFNLSKYSSSSNHSEFHYLDIFIKSTLLYLYELEREDIKNNKQILDRFTNIKKEFITASSLSEEDKYIRNNIRREFSNYFNISNIEEVKTNDNSLTSIDKKEPLKINLEIFSYYQYDYKNINYVYNEYNFNLTIQRINGRKYKISNPNRFLQNYKNHTKYKISSKDEEILLPSSFIETSAKIIEKISLLCENKYSNSLTLSNTALVEILILNKDNPFIYNDKEYILKDKKVDAKIDVNGDINFTFSIGSFDFYGQYQKYAIAINNGEAYLLEFDNEIINKLFFFNNIHDKKELNYIKDLFNEKLLPQISTNVIELNVSKDNNSPFSIKLFIELTEKNTLTFKTEYYNNDILINDLSIIDNNSYNKLIKNTYIQILTSLGAIENGEIKDEDKILLFLKADLTNLRKVCELYLNDALKNKNIKSIGKVNIKVEGKEDLLVLSVFFQDYTSEDIYKILQAYHKKKKFYKLNNDIILLEDEEIKKLNDLKEELKLDKNLTKERLPFFEALKLKAFADNKIELKMDDYLQSALSEIIEFKNYKLDLSKELSDSLRDYQNDAIKWMCVLAKYHLSGVLADDMGLGKTLETISFISLIKEEKPILIISPKSVLYNWKDEFNKWKQTINVTIIDGNKNDRIRLIDNILNNKKEVYLTSYDMLRQDLENYANKIFSLVIIDEAQYIKNAATLKSKAVKDLVSTTRFALSGTPIENSLTDLWSIFDFLMPGYLPSLEKFKKEYEKEDNKKEELSKKVKPFILRRTKKEVLASLPPKTTNVIKVTLTDKQKDLYTAYLAKAKSDLFSSENISPISVLSALTKLRQICVDPSTFIENYDEMSSKISITIETIKNSIENSHKVLVFSSFTSVLEHLRSYLDSENIPSYYICGQTSGELRLSLANKFNNEDKVNVMLVSLKAGGTGLNLQGADIVIHIDPWWNFASEEQASDRAYRIGQTRPVFVYKFISFDTIEEKVLSLQEKKKELYNTIIKSGKDGISGLKKEDIDYLLS